MLPCHEVSSLGQIFLLNKIYVVFAYSAWIYTQSRGWNVLEMIHYWNAWIWGVWGCFTQSGFLHSTAFLLLFYGQMCRVLLQHLMHDIFLKMQMLMLKEKRVFRTCIFTFYCLMSHVFKHKNAFSKNCLLNSSYIRHNPTRFLYGLWRKCLMYENNKSGKEGLNTEAHKMCVC